MANGKLEILPCDLTAEEVSSCQHLTRVVDVPNLFAAAFYQTAVGLGMFTTLFSRHQDSFETKYDLA